MAASAVTELVIEEMPEQRIGLQRTATCDGGVPNHLDVGLDPSPDQRHDAGRHPGLHMTCQHLVQLRQAPRRELRAGHRVLGRIFTPRFIGHIAVAVTSLWRSHGCIVQRSRSNSHVG